MVHVKTTLVAGISALIGTVLPSPAFAGEQEIQRFNDSFSFVDPNYCGTGEEILVSGNVRGTEFFSDDAFKAVVKGRITFTNPDTEDVVILRFANLFTDKLVSGDPEGVHIVEATYRGLPEMFKREHGGVITRDAGLITFRMTFDGDELLDEEIIIRGPHPQAEADFNLTCEVIPGALGIE